MAMSLRSTITTDTAWQTRHLHRDSPLPQLNSIILREGLNAEKLPRFLISLLCRTKFLTLKISSPSYLFPSGVSTDGDQQSSDQSYNYAGGGIFLRTYSTANQPFLHCHRKTKLQQSQKNWEGWEGQRLLFRGPNPKPTGVNGRIPMGFRSGHSSC